MAYPLRTGNKQPMHDVQDGKVVRAYGGVLIDAQARVLVRKPTGGHAGYAWTFPKGRPEANARPLETAQREVLEETGYRTRILAAIPGAFTGTATVTEYFLMAPEGTPERFDPLETEEIRWVSAVEAFRLISETRVRKGRDRDLKVLRAALAVHARLGLD
jgi:8-oxo-dGTP pyrophosphatase MutT (NUDIX family)